MDRAVRRIVGAAAFILLIALGRLLVAEVGSDEGTYEVVAVLGEAGSGLVPGSEVEVRGVPVGEVVDVAFVEGEARAVLRIEDAFPVPRDVRVDVAAKTFLGPKEIHLVSDGPLDPPYLADGDVLRVEDRSVTEVQDVVVELDRILDDVPPEDLATLVDALGSFDDGDAEVLARNIEQGAELARFAARTAPAQVARLSALADIVDALAGQVASINRLNATLPDWVTVLPDRQADVRATSEALSSFAVGLAEFLEVERPTLEALLVTGDRVGAVIEPRAHEIGRLVFGIYRYARIFGEHGGSLDDGTEHSWFRAHIGEEGQIEEFCRDLPPELEQAAPGCVTEDER